MIRIASWHDSSEHESGRSRYHVKEVFRIMSSFEFPGKRSLSTALVCLLFWQTCGALSQVQVDPQSKLRLVIVEGNEAVNDIGVGTAVEPVVRIEDERSQPLAGAMVVFTLPETGAGGVFADGSKSLIVHTDLKGLAAARGLRPNKTEGPFEIRVDASFQGLTASASISQTNVVPIVVPAAKPPSKKGLLFAIIGGVAAAGILAASAGGGGGGTPPPPPTTVSAGSPTVGPP
jgi:hypothetical protein